MVTLTNSLILPEAHISVNKNRQKVHSGKVYLNDNTEFMLELFNPTQNTILAKISLNGKLISQSGLVLKPGQRYFLDRYLDIAKKFKFETYEVESSSDAIKAIDNNGTVEISFYNEKVNYTYTISNNFNNNFSTGGYVYGTYTGSPCTLYTNSTNSCSLTSVSLNINWADLRQTQNQTAQSKSNSIADTIKTGRVELGNKSNQSFENVNLDFEWFPTNVITYKLLPNSQKIVEVKDLVKNYCTSCGCKIKSDWKYCPNCSLKI